MSECCKVDEHNVVIEEGFCNKCGLSEHEIYVQELEIENEKYIKLQKGVDDIQTRIEDLTPEQFRDFLVLAKDKLDVIIKEADDDPTWSINAFQRLKKMTAMLLTWDEYYVRLKKANGIK